MPGLQRAKAHLLPATLAANMTAASCCQERIYVWLPELPAHIQAPTAPFHSPADSASSLHRLSPSRIFSASLWPATLTTGRPHFRFCALFRGRVRYPFGRIQPSPATVAALACFPALASFLPRPRCASRRFPSRVRSDAGLRSRRVHAVAHLRGSEHSLHQARRPSRPRTLFFHFESGGARREGRACAFACAGARARGRRRVQAASGQPSAHRSGVPSLCQVDLHSVLRSQAGQRGHRAGAREIGSYAHFSPGRDSSFPRRAARQAATCAARPVPRLHPAALSARSV
eukprot:4282761-Pleurochrysis_carterae.AAC.2